MVEDSADIRELWFMWFTFSGFTVVAAANGRDALELVRRDPPDVVLMDLSMPRMGGLEATRHLLGQDPSIRIVLFTSAPDGRQVSDALRLGAVACVFKGAGRTELLRAVRAAALCA